MSEFESDWEERVAACWGKLKAENISETELVTEIDALTAEHPADDPAAAFERVSARDGSRLESDAEPLYRLALSSGRLNAQRRLRAIIQLARTLRLIGCFDESEHLLRAELARCAGSADPNALPDETRAFLALTLGAQGRSTEAAAIALIALAPHLSRYSRAVSGNAEEFANPQDSR